MMNAEFSLSTLQLDHAYILPCLQKVESVQGMAEYLLQGKHYAATQGRDHFTVDDVFDLPGMYDAAHKPQSIKEVVTKVYMPLHM